ncbi:MAG: BrnT family toxin [Leptospirales bacterium]
MLTNAYIVYTIDIRDIEEMITFSWDDQKGETNLKKHGVTFNEAKSVFYDDNARLKEDDEHSESENRFVLMGMSEKARILIVVHCHRETEKLLSIISARKATKNESKAYRGFIK